jgi:hypothetical protein
MSKHLGASFKRVSTIVRRISEEEQAGATNH